MKKIITLIIALTLVTGFVMADDIGLTAALQFGVDNMNKADDGEPEPWIKPSIAYGSSFVDGSLDLYAKLAYLSYFKKNDLDSAPMYLYFDFSLTYNLSLSSGSTLSFILENEVDKFMLSNRPESEDGSGLCSIFEPAINFRQGLDIGDIYANLCFPITYVQYVKDVGTPWVDFKAKLGWDSSFGLGLWIREVMNLKVPEWGETGHAHFDACASYSYGPFYAEVEADIYKDFSDNGMDLIPMVQYTIIDNLNVWLSFDIYGLGGAYDATFSPSLGISYSF